MGSALTALETQIRDDLAKTSHPNAAWLEPKRGLDGKPALDVLIVGAGQSGLATAFGLMRSQVTNVLVVDKAEEGEEGPWLSYARMHTLRSPKDFTGPDLDIPSLTYQSWHEARFGKENWQNLDLIPRELWAEYLLWFKRAVGLTVRRASRHLHPVARARRSHGHQVGHQHGRAPRDRSRRDLPRGQPQRDAGAGPGLAPRQREGAIVGRGLQRRSRWHPRAAGLARRRQGSRDRALQARRQRGIGQLGRLDLRARRQAEHGLEDEAVRPGPPSEAWVWVDLGSAKSIGTMRWVFGEYGIGDYFVIEGSNNLRTWSYITKRNGKPVGVWQEKTTSVTYRYIRFRFENPHHDLYLGGLAEVQVWAPGTAPPLPAPARPPRQPVTPTATTPPNSNYPMYGSSRSSNSTLPKAVWDGDLNTTWQTNGEDVPNSAYVYVTIGSVLPIGTIRWIYGTADIGDDLTIQVSNDKVTWTNVHTAGNAPVGEWQAVNLTDVSGKYIRWFFRNPNNDPVIGGLAKVEIYAPGAYKGDVEPSRHPPGPRPPSRPRRQVPPHRNRS